MAVSAMARDLYTWPVLSDKGTTTYECTLRVDPVSFKYWLVCECPSYITPWESHCSACGATSNREQWKSARVDRETSKCPACGALRTQERRCKHGQRLTLEAEILVGKFKRGEPIPPPPTVGAIAYSVATEPPKDLVATSFTSVRSFGEPEKKEVDDANEIPRLLQ